MLKYLSSLVILVLAASIEASACSKATIVGIVGKIDPYYVQTVGSATREAVQTLSLCDENLSYAGELIGLHFDPYYTNSTSIMVSVLSEKAPTLNPDFSKSLGLAVIAKLDLYYYNSTVSMLKLIRALAESNHAQAKEFALRALGKSDNYYKYADEYLHDTVDYLTKLATTNPPVGGSIWAFRTDNRTCESYSEPWGTYRPCPHFYASVSDKLGNRLVLSCWSEKQGIDFRLRPSTDLWNRLGKTNIESLTFGTESIDQDLGVPYSISRDSTLMAEEPLAEELLNALRTDKSLTVGFRLDSGESQVELKFALKGSNLAIGKLLKNCR